MTKRRLAVVAGFGAVGLWAQYGAAPTTYSVSQINGTPGGPIPQQITRDGSKVVVDQGPPGGSRTRTLYDLQAHTTVSWDLSDAGGGCGTGTFSGDWGDPFASSEELRKGLGTAKEGGTETVNGVSTKIYTATDAKSGMKGTVWVEPKYGLTMKMQIAGPDGKTFASLEVKNVSYAKPLASMFVLPAGCKAGSPAAKVPTEAERFAAETGGNGSDFADATMPPSSQNSCTVLFRVVKAGSMQPITSGLQVGIDKTANVDHMPGYTIGLGAAGHSTFAGGGLQDVTAQYQNGTLRMDNAPAQFHVEMVLGDGQNGSALIYRHCVAPQTVLLYVVKNPDKLSEGTDWLWVKAGKYAK